METKRVGHLLLPLFVTLSEPVMFSSVRTSGLRTLWEEEGEGAGS